MGYKLVEFVGIFNIGIVVHIPYTSKLRAKLKVYSKEQQMTSKFVQSTKKIIRSPHKRILDQNSKSKCVEYFCKV